MNINEDFRIPRGKYDDEKHLHAKSAKSKQKKTSIEEITKKPLFEKESTESHVKPKKSFSAKIEESDDEVKAALKEFKESVKQDKELQRDLHAAQKERKQNIKLQESLAKSFLEEMRSQPEVEIPESFVVNLLSTTHLFDISKKGGFARREHGPEKKDPEIAVHLNTVNEDIKTRIDKLEAKKNKLTKIDSSSAKKELSKVNESLNKLNEIRLMEKKMQEKLTDYLEYSGEIAVSEKQPSAKKILDKAQECQKMVTQPIEKAKAAIGALEKAKEYINIFEQKYLLGMEKNAEQLTHSNIEVNIEALHTPSAMTQSLIEEWKQSDMDLKDFLKARLSKAISDSHKEIASLESDIENKLETSVGEKLEQINKAYDDFLNATYNQRKGIVEGINVVGLNTSSAKGLAKAFEVMYTIGSLIKKPSEEMDEEVRAIFKLNKMKGRFLDDVGEFIMDPKTKVASTFRPQ